MPRKENSKAKTWERDRRSRMNAYFNNLAELLPPQSDGRKRNKVDIIIQAIKYIKELHNKTDDLIQTSASAVHKDELARLKKLVHQLFMRTHLLSNLLKDAGITVPAEPALEKISPLKWSNKINVNTAEKIISNFDSHNKNEKKEKRVEILSTKKTSSVKKGNKKIKVDNQENCENDEKSVKSKSNVEADEKDERRDTEKVLSDSQSNSEEPATTSPEKSKAQKPDRQRNKVYKIAATTSPAATLVFSNAKIMPVVTPISTLSPNIIMSSQPRPSSNSSIILNNAQPSQMFVVQPVTTNPVRNSVISIQNPVLNQVPNVILNSRTWASNVKEMINSTKIGGHKGILPKGRKNLTTTMSYKVPIPAIHKDKNENSDVAKKGLKSKKQALVKKEGKKVEKNGKKRAANVTASCSKKQKVDDVKEKEENTTEKSVDNSKTDEKEKIEEETLTVEESQKKETKTVSEEAKIESVNVDKKSSSEEAKETPTEPVNKEEVKKSPKTSKPDKKVNDEIVVLESEKKQLQIEEDAMTNLGNNFDLLESSDPGIVNDNIIAESDKILLNLDTNTTTTMKLEITTEEVSSKSSNLKEKEEEVRHLSYSSNNTFVPINKSETLHSELSNDIFASLQVPSSSHNPESISPTVAFLTAFPLVSSLSGKPVALEEEIKDDFNQSQTPPMILQIGAMEPNSFKLKSVDESQAKSSRADVKPETGPTKGLPKIVSNETIKEPFKIMQQVEPKIHTSVDVVIDPVQREPAKSTGEIQHGETKSITNEITQFESQVGNLKSVSNLKSYEIHKDEVGIGDGIGSKFEEQQFSEECQQVCQPGCSKDNSVRTDHYNYQNCPINTYNDQVPAFEIRQDYKHPNFSNSQTIEPSKSVHSTTAPINQNEIMSGNLNSRVNSEHLNEKFGSQKKIATSDYQQNITYSGDKQKNNSLPESKEMINKIPESGTHYQNRSNEDQSSYIDLYDKGGRKITHEQSFTAEKSHSVRTSYPQQQATFVTTNYDQNSINRSTTTMAHNSSNFSISSWTTISPMNANSEANSTISQFDQNPSHDLNQPKPICETLNYLPLQKENTSQSQSYVPHSNAVSYDKSRSKQPVDVHKRSFNDPSKNRNIRPIVSSQKQTRGQTQSQVSNSEYKFNADTKNKLKYPIDLDSYIQSDFLNLDPRQQQQPQPKPSSQPIQPVKQDNKSNYVITEFDAQPQFEPDQNNSRYNSDIYVSSNFKQQNLPHKPFQVQAQPISQHEQQQQQQQQQQSSSKSKSSQNQFRPTVNWMMTPEIKHNSTNIGDIILPPIGKELEFCHQNNFFSQSASYNQGSSNQFYNNYDVTPHSFPNIPVLQGEPKRASEGTFYSEEQPFSWSPSKNMTNLEQNQNLKLDQQHTMPSTLPTLVGDLALGTNLPEKQNFPPFSQNLSIRSELGKEKEKDPTNRDYQMLNNQNVQHQSQSMSFLSVSQLVEQEKAEKQQQQQHNHHQQQQQQQRKHQRKANSNPRGGKKQLDIRKSMNQHEEQKTVAGFGDQNFQHHQQPQQQNDVHWRGRNCKSNYTAEALIGNDGNQEKNAKYNYHQNKFPGGLHSTDPMMPINYFPNVDNTGGYSQVVNQNFNHSYGYSSNANIYPNANFISSISNNPNYMMSLHENPDYLDSNNFLLPPNVTTSSSNPPKNQHLPKHNQNCDKRSYSSNQKKSRRKTDAVQNFEFPLSGITSPLDDYHHTASFLPHTASLYQNHAHQVNVYPKGMNALAPPPPPGPATAPPPSSSLLPSSSQISTSSTSTIPTANSVLMHHPSGTSLTNFNLTTIFPEMNDKVPGYKSSGNGVSSCLMQSSHSSSSYHTQRGTYTNSLTSQMPQMSDSSQFSSDITRSSTSDIVHYKNP